MAGHLVTQSYYAEWRFDFELVYYIPHTLNLSGRQAQARWL